MSSGVGEIKMMEEGVMEGGVKKSVESEELREVYYPRRNGWNWPWHPLQILAWVFIVFFTISYFGFLVHYIPGAWRSIGYIVSLSYLIYIFCNFSSLSIHTQYCCVFSLTQFLIKVACAIFVTHISASLVTSIMDPAEAAVRRRGARKAGGFLRTVFDRKKHKRVIENHYCNLCEVHV